MSEFFKEKMVFKNFFSLIIALDKVGIESLRVERTIFVCLKTSKKKKKPTG